MMRYLAAIILFLASLAGYGQTKINLSNQQTLNNTNISKLNISATSATAGYLTSPKFQEYKDTLNCLVRVIDTLTSTDKWIKAKVIFGGGLHNPTMKTTWGVGYAGMAIGPFDNKVIFDNAPVNGFVIQVSIIDKNLYKN